MEFQLRNIGCIKEADIKIEGLTVVAGHNDIGKSFIGKTIFSLVHSYNGNQNVIKMMKDVLDRLNLRINDVTTESLLENVRYISEEIKKYETENNDNLICGVHLIEHIKHNFDNQIKNYLSAEESTLSVFEKSEKIIDVHFVEDVVNVEILSTENALYKDVTYIDSPLIFEYFKWYVKSSIEEEEKGLSQIKVDLFKKLVKEEKEIFELIPIKNAIQKIINGDFEIEMNPKKIGVMYSRDGNKIPEMNVASGIKSFGLLSLLLKKGQIHKQSLLVIDEPEVHLHPKWQIYYAEVICELVKQGIPILINSHSSYFLQALKKISDKKNLQEKTNFYTAEMTEQGAVYQNVTENIEPILKQLTEPIDRLLYYF